MVEIRFEWLKVLEILIVVIVIVLGLGIIANPSPEATYVPNAVTGLTTTAGILIAFLGFWVSRVYSQANREHRIWTSFRLLGIIGVVFDGLVFVMLGLNWLAYGSLESAYKATLFGTIVIVFLLFDVAIMMFVEIMSKFKTC